jgi:hypothetical protein
MRGIIMVKQTLGGGVEIRVTTSITEYRSF